MSDERREEQGDGDRRVVYCIVPRELAPKLHEPLRRHFEDDPSVEVIVERRAGDRRRRAERRSREPGPGVAEERRAIRSSTGRRMGDRRALLAPVAVPELPRKARAHADRLAFVEALAPGGERAEDLDTARLIARFQGGDRDAFAALYLRYFERVYNYLRVVLNDHHEAEDGAQQVFTQVLEALPGYEHRREPFRGWLFVVVRNHAVSLVRKRSRLEPVDPAELNRRREPLAEVEEAGLWALDWVSDTDLVVLIERLPLAQRQALLLRYMLDLSHGQVAAVLGRSPEQVRALQHRALTFLRDRLSSLGRGAHDRSHPRMVRRPGHAYVLRMRRYSLLY